MDGEEHMIRTAIKDITLGNQGLYPITRDCITLQGIVSYCKGLYHVGRDCILLQGIVSY